MGQQARTTRHPRGVTLAGNKQSPHLPAVNKVVTVCSVSCSDSKRQSSASGALRAINHSVSDDWQVHQSMATELQRTATFKITEAGELEKIDQLFGGNPSSQVMYHFK